LAKRKALFEDKLTEIEQVVASAFPAVSKMEDKEESRWIEKQFEIMLVTPMIGGSAEPGKINETSPIRATAIRGHLRFWWRATRGAVCKDVAELRQKEAEIFGDTSRPSPFRIWVEESNSALKLVTELMDKSPVPPYVSFMHKGNDFYMRPGFKFTLKIRFTSTETTKKLFCKELRPALWAWINFGGIGARTRRGCGSLYCSDFSPSEDQDLQKWYEQHITKFKLTLPDICANQTCEWPVLCNTIYLQKKPQTIQSAWTDAIRTLRWFRQAKSDDTNRTIWPEADSIRNMTLDRPKASSTLKNPEEYRFPRAQLGLPIQFQFRNKKSEPYTTVLMPGGKDRLASPLIIKAIAVSESSSSRVSDGYGVIAVLSQPRLSKLTLKRVKTDEKKNGPKPGLDPQKFDQRLNGRPITEKHIYSHLDYKNSFNNPMQLRYDPNDNSPHNNFRIRATHSAIKAFLYSREVKKWRNNFNNQNTNPFNRNN